MHMIRENEAQEVRKYNDVMQKKMNQSSISMHQMLLNARKKDAKTNS